MRDSPIFGELILAMRNLFFASLVIVLVGGFASAVTAEELYCPDVYACDGEGNVVEPFNQGPCAAVYAEQCSTEAQNLISSQLASCESDNDDLRRRARRLKKKLRRARRRIRSSS